MKSSGLADLQIAFHDHLLNLPSAIGPAVHSEGRISAGHRLHIYHNAYRVRLLENLRDAYEKTWIYLGDETFESTARAFIESHPPSHRNLRWHGAEFPHWLTERFPDDLDIAELAMIDWQLRQAFDGPNATPVAASDLAGLGPEDWARVGFQFVPTLHIAPLRFNSVAIWHALDQEQRPPIAEVLPETSWLLVWRKGWQPHFRTVGVSEHAALRNLRDGASFAETCADLSQRFPDQEAARVAAESLRTWLQDELIGGMAGLEPQRINAWPGAA